MPFRKISLIVATLVIFLQLNAVSSFAADITLNTSVKFQTIEGFGGGFMYGVWPYGRGNKDELYDSIFNKAGCNIVRIKNSYDPEAGNSVKEIPMMVEVQQKYPDVKITMAAWSPPKYLKKFETVEGKVDGVHNTLKKENGDFVYDKYGDYWMKSIQHFQQQGVKLHWISIQNEPDYPAAWDGCMFVPSSSFGDYALYGSALDAVYKKTKSLGVSFIAADNTGLEGIKINSNFASTDQYLSNLDLSQVAAISHHFYNGRTSDKMMQLKQKYPSKPKYQTEYLINEDKTPGAWFEHCKLIQDALVFEDISMYLIFALAYKNASTHCFFSLDDLTGGDTYTVKPIYFGFKHFSKSIKRDWRRVETSSGNSLKVSAFSSSSNDSIAVIVVNTGSATSIDLKGLPTEIDTGDAFQTTKGNGSDLLKKYAPIASFGKVVPTINLDANSITSINLWKSEQTVSISGKINSQSGIDGGLKAKSYGNERIVVSLGIAANSASTLSIFDMNGKIIANRKAINGNTCSFDGPFVSGTYMVKLISGDMVSTSSLVIP